jgi:hypothetical protein
MIALLLEAINTGTAFRHLEVRVKASLEGRRATADSSFEARLSARTSG